MTEPSSEDPSRRPEEPVGERFADADTGGGGRPGPETGSDAGSDAGADKASDETGTDSSAESADAQKDGGPPSAADKVVRALREVVIIVVIALLASALLRAFVVQAFYVPSGSMLPEIQLQDRILVSRIGDVDRGEVVVFEDPGGWIPPDEQASPPGRVHRMLEWVGLLPATGHEHLVKRAVGLPGDHVKCCDDQGRLSVNGQPLDESDILAQPEQPADNTPFDVVVPAGHIFVLGDNRNVSGDSSKHLPSQDAFVPLDLVVGRAVAVVWPPGHAHLLRVPSEYDDLPDGTTPPGKGVIKPVGAGLR